MTTINDLFFGELSLNLTGPEGSKQYRAASAVWDDCEERLTLLLGGKEHVLLIRLVQQRAIARLPPKGCNKKSPTPDVV
ncbi:hypothetical protein DWV16_04445 [Anaerotruncus sp. AF02-27]|jgi:hypothetical protein|uniref:hypothetical protein n=1 Tax=Anaerotruncus TaxID=244127 RepID=UPI000E4E40B0|nr:MULTISPECIES: hypothetical protein [Anaerotruncus]RGX56317.1 hypothetical protein DWV16_04445 [Anaerotruncus sp. AF02-27]